ncbi:MAG: ECF RNA polymerase sigma-E factor [Syntrophorhabdus sp. PtaB.Bin047]|jgi:RNA polymerase sigma-70 factor (ECF subfamily)|nr:MAG: ECF RNA polymerase sigma-E factor [Syntrophorhabdus sp. PtaB.Bin047]
METIALIWHSMISLIAGDGTKPAAGLSHTTEGRREERDEDAQYVALCQGGEPAAFEVLVRRHQKRMFNIAYRMTGNYEDAGDVVQEAFLSAYRTIKHFRGDARFSTWLYGIVVNHARNRMRQAGSRAYHEPVSIDDPPVGQDGGPAFDPPSREAPALDVLVRKEMQQKVQDCINGLEKEHREIIVLRDIQGFSYEEITGMLGIPDGTVKSRLSRARNALRESLKKVLGDL